MSESSFIGIEQITVVPKIPEHIKGVINIRGKVVPVISIRKRFGMEEIPYDDRTCIIVLEFEDGNQVVVAHGNGPQVGRIVLAGETAKEVVPPMPFDVCGAMSQGYIGYHMGIRNVWVCLDDPTADYRTLYAENPPQAVTHPVKEQGAEPIEIKPSGPSMGGILAAVCVISILSGGFLWITRKKK